MMTGIIWLVQIVVYPQLRLVRPADYIEYESSHMAKIGLLVGPLMIIELMTAIWIWGRDLIPVGSEWLFYISILLALVIWLSTALIQAPLHTQLSRSGKDDAKIDRLIYSNWLRTICWSGRLILISSIMPCYF